MAIHPNHSSRALRTGVYLGLACLHAVARAASADASGFNARYFEAQLSIASKEPDKAVESLAPLLKAGGCPDFIYNAQAQALKAAGKDKDAREVLEKGIAAFPDSVELMLTRASLDRGAGRVNEAIAGLDKALEKAPRRQAALEMLSDLHLTRLISNPSGSDGDIKELVRIYNQMLETRRGSDRLVPLLVLSTLYLKQGQADKAVAVSGEALKINHRSARIFEAHATALAGAGRNEDAIKVYADGMTALPDDDELCQKAEGFVLEKGGTDRVVRFFVELSANRPDSAGIQQAASRSLMNAKRWPEAETCLRRLLGKKPDDISSQLALLRVWMEMGRVDEAIEQAKKLGEASGDLAPVITLSVAEALESRGRRGEAVDLLQNYNLKHPLNENVTLGLAALLLEDKQQDKATALLEQLKANSPDSFTAVSLLAGVYADGQRYDDARKMLGSLPGKMRQDHAADVVLIDCGLYVNEAIQRENKKSYPEALGLLDRAQSTLDGIPDGGGAATKKRALDLKTSIMLSRGQIHQKQGNAAASEAAYRKALETNPEDAETWNGMGYYYAETNQKLDQAETMIRKALEIKPDAPHIVDSLGWVFFRQGRIADAVEQLEKAVKAMGDDPSAAEVCNHLGDAYAKANRPEDARKIWQKALELKGDADAEAIKRKLESAAK